MARSKEILTRTPQEVAAYGSAVEGIVNEVSYSLETLPREIRKQLPVLWAEAGLAEDKPAAMRTSREATLVRMRKVVPVLRTAIEAGLVTSESDSRDLASGLMLYDGDARSTLSYLRGNSNSLAKTPRSPRELINAIEIHQEMLEGELHPDGAVDDTVPSLAIVFRAADHIGAQLDSTCPNEGLDTAIVGTIQSYKFRRDISRADSEGDSYHIYPLIDATTIGETPIGFATNGSADQSRDFEFEAFFNTINPDENI